MFAYRNKSSFKICISPAIGVWVMLLISSLRAQAIFDEMRGHYNLIYDSTGIWPDGNGAYDYNRKFISEVALDDEGRSVLSRPATPVLDKDDKINISAYTRLASGEILPADTSDMVTRLLPGDRRWIFVNFRQAEPGAILHLEWQISSTEANIAGKRFLGRTVPVEKAQIILTIPETWVFNFALSPGVIAESRQDIYRDPGGGPSSVSYSWVAGKLPGLGGEEYAPPMERLIPCLYFSYYYDTGWAGPDTSRVDWKYLAELYSQQFRAFIRNSSAINTAADSLLSMETRPGKLAHLAYNWLGQHFRAVESEIALSGNINGALQRARGTQAEASAILYAFFERLNISCAAYLVATRDKGEPLAGLPALFWFDRVILAAFLDNDTVWIDPQYQLAQMGILPFEDQGAKALRILGAADFSMIPISDYHDNGKAIHLKLDFDSEGGIKGEATEIYSGAMISEISSYLQGIDEPEKQAPWEKKLAKSFPNSKIQRFLIMPPDSADQVFKIGYAFTTGPLVRPFANRVYIPMDLLGRWADLPVLPARTRQSSVELRRPRFEFERISLKISPPFEVEFLPSNYSENDEIGEIYSVARGEKNAVTITRGFGLKRPVLPVSEYGSLRRFLARAHTEADKQIILKRVE